MVDGVNGQNGGLVVNHVVLEVKSATGVAIIHFHQMGEKNVLETLLINDHVITTLAVSNH